MQQIQQASFMKHKLISMFNVAKPFWRTELNANFNTIKINVFWIWTKAIIKYWYFNYYFMSTQI